MAQEALNVRSICHILGRIKTKWHVIGIQLDIPPSKLAEFKKEDDPLSAVVDFWLRGNVAEAVISWKSIVKAVKSPHVDEPGLAEEIREKYCQKLEEDEAAKVDYPASSGKVSIFCHQHDGKEMELYCKFCEELICHDCTRKGEKHHDHDFHEDARKVISFYLEKQLTDVKEVRFRNCQISDLMNQLHTFTQDALAANTALMDTTQTQLLSLQENLEASNHGAVLTKMRDHVTMDTWQQVDKIIAALQSIKRRCQNCSKVDSSKYCTTLKSKAMTSVGEKATTVLQTPMNEELSEKFISCELVSSMTGAKVKGNILRKESCLFELSYRPTIKGWHQLHIKVKEQHINGSPFLVSASLQSDIFGTPMLIIDGVRNPEGVAVNKKGNFIVTSRKQHCITVFNPSGEKLKLFGNYGSSEGQFEEPCGVAVDAEDNILVADSENHRIQKFTADGTFLTSVGSKGDKSYQFDNPYGIAVSPQNGQVYVVERGNNRIQILNSDLSYVDTFGKTGKEEGCLRDPLHVACDSIGNVYVVERLYHRIQVFTAEGKFLKMFGMHGEGKGELNEPCGIAVDSNSRVLVSDHGNNCVSVFTQDGQFLRSFGSNGKEPGKFWCPAGLAVDSNGVMYVCDKRNDRVQLL